MINENYEDIPKYRKNKSKIKKPYLIEYFTDFPWSRAEPHWEIWNRYATKKQRDQAFLSVKNKSILKKRKIRKRTDNER